MKFKCDGVVEVVFKEPLYGKPHVIVDFGENHWEVIGEGKVDDRLGIITINYQTGWREVPFEEYSK
jgi:hypothetical protein